MKNRSENGKRVVEISNTSQENKDLCAPADEADFSYVHTTARIARYDDVLAAPRVIEIPPSQTESYIEGLASTVDKEAKLMGGDIPYTVIREITENFIHANFKEVVVSILDGGNTIKFADQGPGIENKEKAQLPGFTSATEPMKKYIRGVGSGLPLTKEYLNIKHGTIVIEDNLRHGAVVTVSLVSPRNRVDERPGGTPRLPRIPLSARQREILVCFSKEGALGVTEIVSLTGIPNSSTYTELQRLEEAGLIEKTFGKKRMLTETGFQTVNQLS